MRKNKLAALLFCGAMLLTACSDTDKPEISVNTGVPSFSTSGGEQSGGVELNVSSESSSNSSDNSSSSSEEPSSAEQSAAPSTSEPPPEISASLATALYCVDDNKLLFSENADKPVAIASITKVLTACTALSVIDPETVITVGSEQALVKPGSSVCFIAEGQRLTLDALISGMMIASGNDAAYTVAVSAARANDPQKKLTDEQAVAVFADMMNSFAAQLGMSHSHFVNPEGWDDEAQYTTASDLLLLAKYALTVPEIRENASTYQKRVRYVSGEIAVWTNSNKLLDPESEYYYENAIGLKTGTTNQAGCCLLAAFEKNGKTYISVVAGAESNDERYTLTKELIDMC